MDNILVYTWLVLFGSSSLALLLTPKITHLRSINRLVGLTALIALLHSLFLTPIAFDGTWMSVGLFAALYSAINAAILFQWQFHSNRTTKNVSKNQFLILLAVLLISLTQLIAPNSFDESISVIGLVIASVLFLKVAYVFVHGLPDSRHRSSLSKKPTVTFAIPARNETHALTQNLQSVLKTNYKKIEFLVLDDCSQDKTSQIIRSFAHDGVRFIKGEAPGGHWVGKTHAYQQLLDEATGEYIVFSGVDTRFQEDSVESLIAFMRAHKIEMCSLMPGHVSNGFLETLLQPMRYLAMIMKTGPRTPASLSTVWIAKRDFLQKNGGMNGFKNSLVPEFHLAKIAAKKNGYRFIPMGAQFGITSRKTFSSQRDTALRAAYPMIKRSLGRHFWVSIGVLAAVIFPLFNVALQGQFVSYSLLSLGLVYVSYMLVVTMSYAGRPQRISPIHFLTGIGLYYYLSVISFVKYEQNQVAWKDRNICEPVITGFRINNSSDAS